jgi:hypothetical protein
LKQLDFNEIQQRGRATEGDLGAICFNPVASTISKLADVQTTEVDAKLESFNVGP